MVMLLYFFVPGVADWLAWDAYQRVFKLAVWIILGAGIYFCVLWLTGLRLRHMTLTTEQV